MADAFAGSLSLPKLPKLIPSLDQNPQVVAFAQTGKGRAALFGVMAVLTGANAEGLVAVGFAALTAYSGRRRFQLMAVGTYATLILHAVARGAQPVWAAASFASLFAFAAVLMRVGQAQGRRGVLSRPVPLLLTLVGLSALLASAPGLSGSAKTFLWTATGMLSAATWFLAYAISNVVGRSARPIPTHLGVLHPFWGSTTTPYGKGAAYLAKFEAHDVAELAVTQIKAAKLLLWARLLGFAKSVVVVSLHGDAGIPTLDQAVGALAAGHPMPHLVSLLAVPLNFADNLLSLAVMGHVFVAYCRYAGFRIPRNMCRPLEARSVAEFWNRYYFYFKELLVDFFFLPTFAALRTWPIRLRLITATFAAAGLGNYLFHVFRDIELVRTLGWRQTILGSQTYVFYCLILAAGIAWSQLSEKKLEPRPRPAIVPAPVRVACFYCLVSIFAYDGRTLTLYDHLHFFFYLWGLWA